MRRGLGWLLAAAGALALLQIGSAVASSTTAKRIAFVRGGDLWTVGAAGTGTTNLGESPSNPSFSSDGQLIYFDDGGTVRVIAAAGPAGSSVGLCAGTDPAISPDGTRLAYVSGGNVTVSALNCSGAVGFGAGSDPAWAPDGTQIAFISGGDVAIAPSTGGAAQTLASSAAESDPAWSPDGAKIAYVSGGELFVMNADGSGRQQLTTNAGDASSPSWAPGGDEIVYAAGGNLAAIAANGSSTRLLPDAAGGSQPDWGLAVANTQAPTITLQSGGTYAEGSQLSADLGTWTSLSGITSFAYQWKRCGSAGTGCVPISGATSGTYQLANGDVGSTVRVTVTATTQDGSAPGTSAQTPLIGSAAPHNVTPPTIGGTPIIGATLTADEGTWTGSNPVFTYQWKACDTSGNNCLDISGATADVYVPGTGDVGKTLRVQVTATNADGTASATSNPTPLVSSNVPTNIALPAITETTLGTSTSYEATAGTWSGAATIIFKYQWRRCDSNGGNCKDVAAAISSRYTPTAADIGARLRVAVTASNSFGQATAVSEPSELIAGNAPVNSFRPSISGNERAGSSLSASPGSWTGSAPITYTYEWRRCNAAGASCAAISGSTSSSYIVQNGDVGARIMVAVTARNSAGTATALSDVTDVIAAGTTGTTTATRPSNTGAPSFTGVLARGRTLTAVSGTWSGTTPMTFSYQWQRCPATGTACTPIALATRSTYVLAAADVNRRIRLLVSAGNAAGSAQALSAISARVAARAPAAARGRTIRGNARANRLTGTNFADTILGLGGNDAINPRGGRDRVFAGPGNDTVSALDGARDSIDCGAGSRDRVVADRIDILRGCERVSRRALSIRGNARANRLTGTNGADTIYGLGGNDTINPRGGRDRVFGGSGNDTINAADGLRDVVYCGAGSDTVIADGIDFVVGCERIRSRRR